jgi:2-hydroxy fatty acid dioxygenase
VPPLLMTLISLGRFFPLGEDSNSIYQPHIGLLFLIMNLGLYLSLDFWSGLISTILYSTGYVICNHLYLSNGPYYGTLVMWVQIIGWGLQFLGHGVFEGRRPALVDNVLLTLAAPLFVVLEVMMTFGYKTHLHSLLKINKLD